MLSSFNAHEDITDGLAKLMQLHVKDLLERKGSCYVKRPPCGLHELLLRSQCIGLEIHQSGSVSLNSRMRLSSTPKAEASDFIRHAADTSEERLNAGFEDVNIQVRPQGGSPLVRCSRYSL